MNYSQSPGDEAAVINGVIDFADVRREAAAQFAHAGGGGGGNDEFQIWRAGFEGLDELRTEVDFANTYGVQPEDMAVGQGLLEIGVVTPKTFLEAEKPVAAALHAPKIIGRSHDEKEREQNVI